MSRLSTVAFVALTLVASLAYAERPYESNRPDNSYDRPLSISRESFKPSDLRPNPRAEIVLPAKDQNVETRYGSPALRPDGKRDMFVPVDETTGQTRGLQSNRDVQRGKPNLRHDAKREAFMPVNEEGRTRSVQANREVQKGKPAMRPEAKRDAFVPVDEATGQKRGLYPNQDMKPAIGERAQEMSRQMMCSFAICE